MVSKTCVSIFICVGLFVAIQTLLPKASALMRADMDELIEDERSRLRQNYVVQRALENLDYTWPKYYAVDAPLPSLILDYANMIRNVILLDNSVDTRTRKTDNIKVKKQNKILSGDACKCESLSESIDLTKHWGIVYPNMVRNVTCSDTCAKPYRCQREIYNMPILKRRPEALTLSVDDVDELNRGYDMPLPRELVRRWAPATVPVTTGCHCTLA